MTPEVSVVIPFFNGGDWIRRALDSALAQRGVRCEVIVADDGSPRPPEPALKAAYAGRAAFTTLPHGGKGAAINAGARLAKAPLICVLDQDDEMLPGRLAAQCAALARTPRADGVYSDYERREAGGRLIDTFISRQASAPELLAALAANRSLFSMQTLALRKAAFDRLGGFSRDPSLTGLDDSEFFVRLLLSGARLRYAPGVFARWTSHPKNFSKSEDFCRARLAYLGRLEALAASHADLKPLLPLFRFHVFHMRGLFFLENGRPKQASLEFSLALRERFSVNACYLRVKSLAAALLERT
jgi:glycosyltransferase involved in cell wall biosynthesis